MGLYLDKSGLGFVIGGLPLLIGALIFGCEVAGVSLSIGEVVGWEGFCDLLIF